MPAKKRRSYSAGNEIGSCRAWIYVATKTNGNGSSRFFFKKKENGMN
jgi:hypothetical protein